MQKKKGKLKSSLSDCPGLNTEDFTERVRPYIVEGREGGGVSDRRQLNARMILFVCFLLACFGEKGELATSYSSISNMVISGTFGLGEWGIRIRGRTRSND
jgi:hypothetical protein